MSSLLGYKHRAWIRVVFDTLEFRAAFTDSSEHPYLEPRRFSSSRAPMLNYIPLYLRYSLDLRYGDLLNLNEHTHTNTKLKGLTFQLYSSYNAKAADETIASR